MPSLLSNGGMFAFGIMACDKRPMITRHHQDGPTLSWATYSDCDTYRYALSRTWDKKGKRVMFVMLNPSKATEQANDPTVGRCEARARTLGFGAFQVTNLFSLRETDPHLMRKHPEPVGPDTDACLLAGARWADMTIAAWGVHGVHQDRHCRVLALFADAGIALHCFGLTKDGHPRHPLYLSYATQAEPWENA